MAPLSRRIRQMAPSPTIAMTKRAFELKAAGVEEGLERIARFCAGLR